MTKDSRCGFCSRVLACWELVLEPQLPHLENENATSPITKGCCELQQRVPEMHWPETLLCKWQRLGFPPQDRASLPLSGALPRAGLHCKPQMCPLPWASNT